MSPVRPHGGSLDAWVAKVNATGASVLYFTFLGGSGRDEANGIAVDAAANAYIAGVTNSNNFPVTATAFQRDLKGGRDAFVTKLHTGGGIIYSTYLGGSENDEARGVAAYADTAFVVGHTDSNNFPFPPNPEAASDRVFHGGGRDAFVARLSAGGSFLLYSTYLGGSGDDRGNGIAVDASGKAYVTGFTSSSEFPKRNPDQPDLKGNSDAFVARLDMGANRLDYSTYLGGDGGDEGHAIAVDKAGDAYVAGHTYSANFPVSPGSAARRTPAICNQSGWHKWRGPAL